MSVVHLKTIQHDRELDDLLHLITRTNLSLLDIALNPQNLDHMVRTKNRALMAKREVGTLV